jgi:hypothetical protein
LTAIAAAITAAMIRRRIFVQSHETLAARASDSDHPMTVAQEDAIRETR